MMLSERLARQRGVSLIEAVVALGVMAFGMLALVGVQATLRGSGDLSRQRVEALRIAQETMESYRAYGALADATPRIDFAEIASVDRTAVSVAGTVLQDRLNTTFYSTITAPISANSAAVKPVGVTVDWIDRNGQFQSVELRSMIAGVPPEQVGSLSIPPAAEPFAASRGRHRSVPPAAFSVPRSSLSIFKPPQGAGGSVAWVFNNVTGLVVGLCNLSAGATNESLTASEAESCVSSAVTTSAQLLSGYIRFSTGDPAAGNQAEAPSGGTRNLDVVLSLTTTHTPAPTCFDDATEDASLAATRREVTYYCLIYSNLAGTWAGRTRIAPQASNSASVWTIAAAGSTSFKVCRYTPLATDVGTRNIDHPLDYTESGGARGAGLSNQNFLVIGADFSCPPETPAEGDLFNSNTLLHQSGVWPYDNP